VGSFKFMLDCNSLSNLKCISGRVHVYFVNFFLWDIRDVFDYPCSIIITVCC